MKMSHLSIAVAVKIVSVSESTLRRDLKIGKVFSTTDKTSKRVVDAAELERVYGILNVIDTHKNGTDTDEIVALLKEQVSDLKSQLAKSEAREIQLLDIRDTTHNLKVGASTS